ncbi:Diacylglycerol O-acyltransferase 2B [Leucoagaricus sp. SymC.cos]|nr:Diacylglycerol O-acyltransferase 2B [Leucoagaricus sp. SymC.cos]
MCYLRFVPAKIPRKRRLQTLAVAVWSCMIVITACLFFYLCSFPPLWPFLTIYWIWMNYIDTAPERGKRMSQWVRRSKFWKYFAEYYPVSGALITFATEATGFSEQFPGITPHLLTLTSNFKVPFYRELLMALGIYSVSKASCSNILKSGPGSSITIVIGGAAESLSAHPGTVNLTLRKRLGFIKVALQHGADLVPVFSFGENDIYEQMPNEKGTTVYALQKLFQSIFGFTLPLFHGRGLLNYNLGLLPYRRRIVVVIGKPIPVKQHDKPTMEEVSAVQEKYIAELTRIWDTYKDEHAKARLRELEIID